ncbi:MAG: type IV pilus secretin PilQ [Nitrospiria bacterium]
MIRPFIRGARFTQIVMIIALSGLTLSCSVKKVEQEVSPRPVVVIQDIYVAEGTDQTVVEIESEAPMIYATFRLSDPDRLVVDIADASLDRFSEEIVIEEGPVRVIRPGKGGGPNSSRLEFELSGDVETDVRTEDLTLVVEVTQVGGGTPGTQEGFVFFADETPPPAEEIPEKPAEIVPDETLKKLEAPDAGLEMVEVETEPVAPSPLTADMITAPDLPEGTVQLDAAGTVSSEAAEVLEEDVVISKPAVDASELQGPKAEEMVSAVGEAPSLPLFVEPGRDDPLPPANKVSFVGFEEGEDLTLVVLADGVLEPHAFFIGFGDKRRLVIDLPDVVSASSLKSRISVDDPRVKRVRIGQHQKNLRLVLDLLSPISYMLAQDQGELRVLINGPSQAKKEMQVASALIANPEATEAEPEDVLNGDAAPGKVDVTNEVEGESGLSGLQEKPLDLPVPAPDLAETGALPIPMPVPDIGASEADSSSNQQETSPIAGQAEKTMMSKEASDTEIIEKTPPVPVSPPPPVVEVPVKKESDPEALLASEAEEKEAKKKVLMRRRRREAARAKREARVSATSDVRETQPPERPKYTGRKISLDFQDAEITNVVRLIADVSGLNFVMGDDVKGSITIKMDDVPWDQALEIILEIQNLGMVRNGDIIRIATLANLTKQRNEKAQAMETKIRAEELMTRVVYVNYAKAEQMKTLLLKLLSSRGEIMVASRVNALVVKDIQANLDQVEQMARKLDTKTPQVLIEARVVEVQPTFKRSLGVKWGADFKTNNGGNSIGIGNATGDSSIFSPSQDFSVNLPAANPLGGIGFSFGRFTESPFQLDLRLSAGESQEMTRIVSTPKIMVLDNNEALIKQGSQIPFQSSSANGGTNIQLIDASLQLKVIPHISPDGGILLELNLTKNEPGPPVQGSDQPSIFEKEVSTQILLMNGETMVIGGIYETKNTESESGVPVLKDIPGLGWLFKNKEKNESTTELLIFITPTIMN